MSKENGVPYSPRKTPPNRESPEEASYKDALDYSSSPQPMFSSLIPYFKLQITICNAIGCSPFMWNNKTQRIQVHESQTRLKIAQLQTYLLIAYTLITTLHFLGSLKLNTLTNTLLGLLFLACFHTVVCISWTVLTKRTSLARMWNTILDLEQSYLPPPDDKKPKDTISKLLMTLGVVTSGALPAFMFMMLLVDPCKPPHLGFILYKDTTSCAVPMFPKILVVLCDTFMWTIASASACFGVFHGMFLGLRCLDQYLQLLTSGFKRRRNFRSQDHKKLVVFAFYRRFQLLGGMYNEIFQSLFIPGLIVGAIFVIIVCLYACVKLHSLIPMPGFAFFPLLSWDGFSVIYIVKIAAGVFVKSKRFVAALRKNERCGRKTVFRKQVRSFDWIRICFGASNFVDEKTPIVFLNFALTQTVSLMLLT